MNADAKGQLARIEMLVRRELLFWLRVCVYITYPVVLLIALGVVHEVFFEQTPTERSAAFVETQIVGGDIVDALEAYRAENHKYPDSLEDLVPTYLEKVTRPPWGDNGWKYLRYQDAFEVVVGFDFVDESLYPVMIYNSSDCYWYVDD